MVTDKQMISRAVNNYMHIQQMFFSTNVRENREFQKLFNGSYKLISRSQAFYNKYYELMEYGKKHDLSLEYVLRELYAVNGTLELSFATKLLATINPNYPIWDKNVRNLLHIPNVIGHGSIDDRIEDAIRVYGILQEFYNAHEHDKEVIDALKEFNIDFPEAKELPYTRKFDFILWASKEI